VGRVSRRASTAQRSLARFETRCFSPRGLAVIAIGI
jgi:hypothetical protein